MAKNNRNKNRKANGGQNATAVSTLASSGGRLTNYSRLSGRQPIFPRSVRTTLCITAEAFSAVATGTPSFFVSVPGNGVYQPLAGNTNAANTALGTYFGNVTGGTAFATATPPGFAAWTTMYKEYRVSKSRITVTALPNQSTLNVSNDRIHLSVFPYTETTSVTAGYLGTVGSVVPAGAEAAQMPYGDTVVVSSFGDPNSRAGGTITLECSTAKINGLSKLQYDADVTNAIPIASNPGIAAGNQSVDLPWQWGIAISTINNINLANSVALKIELEYEITFSDPVSPLA